jgi:hypothetical protein
MFKGQNTFSDEYSFVNKVHTILGSFFLFTDKSLVELTSFFLGAGMA